MGSFPVCIPYLMFVILKSALIKDELKVAVHLFYVGSRFRMEVKITECIDG